MQSLLLNGSDWTVAGYWQNQWQFGRSGDYGQTDRGPVPAIAATVPGAIHADLLRAGIIPDWQDGVNAERSEWVNNREWVYVKTVTVPAEWDGGRASCTPGSEKCRKEAGKMPAPQMISLECDGLDYSGVVFVDGKQVGTFEGTHLRHQFDLTGLVQPGATFKLEFLFHQSPQIEGVFGYTSQTKIFKPRFGYCWDWCPRVVNVGIWQDVRLVCRGAAEFEHVRVQARLDEDLRNGCVRVIGGTKGTATAVRYQITNRENAIVASGEQACRAGQVDLKIAVDSPRLWWPGTLAEGRAEKAGGEKSNSALLTSDFSPRTSAPALYQLQIELVDADGNVSDVVERTVGFRRVRWLDNPGAPAAAKPYLCEVNGVPLFIRGINWVPLSPFYGTVSRERYEAVLRLYRNMNVNLIRVWGGAILETAAFYELCDELGIMVWQEFPLSSSGIENWPPENPAVIEHLQTIATEYVERRGHHASHVLWCGGNELQGGLDGSKEGMGKPVDELHPLMMRWQELLARIDRGKRFQASSPSGPTFYAHATNYGKGIHHQTHGPWGWGDVPFHKVHEYWNNDDSLFRSENGSPACSTLAALERHKGDQSLWPPRNENRHWVAPAAAWIPWADVNAVFGPIPDVPAALPAIVKAHQYMQAESYRYAAEASRRRFPNCSGYIVWMGHDNLHNTANNSVVQIDGATKPAYDWLQRAYANRHVSLRFDSISCPAGNEFVGQVFVHEDRSHRAAAGMLRASLRTLDGAVLRTFMQDIGSCDTSIPVAELQWMVPQCPGGAFVVELRWESGGAVVTNQYLLSQQVEHPLQPMLGVPAAKLSVRPVAADAVEVTNAGKIAAIGVRLVSSTANCAILTGSNNIILMPTESHVITYKLFPLEPGQDCQARLVVDAFNLDESVGVE